MKEVLINCILLSHSEIIRYVYFQQVQHLHQVIPNDIIILNFVLHLLSVDSYISYHMYRRYMCFSAFHRILG